MTRSQSRKLKHRKQFLAMTEKGFVKIGKTWIKRDSNRHRSYIIAQTKKAAKWSAIG